MKNQIVIETRTVVRIIAILVAFVVGASVLWIVRQAIIFMLLSFFLALALNPPVAFFTQKAPRGSGRFFGTFVSYMLVVGLIGLFLFIAVPPLISGSRELVAQLPEIVEDARVGDGFIADTINTFQLDQQVESLVDSFSARLGAADSPVLSSLGRISSSIVSLLTVLVLTFFMLIEGPTWIKRFWAVYPENHREDHREVTRKMYSVMTSYVNGQIIVALVSALASMFFMIFLARIEPSTAIPLAGLVGFLGLIPVIGTTIASSVVILVALFNGVGAAVIMLIFFIVYQQIENNVIQPLIHSKTVEISPLLIFIAVIIGFTAGGIIGGVISVPIAGMIRVAVLHYIEGNAPQALTKD